MQFNLWVSQNHWVSTLKQLGLYYQFSFVCLLPEICWRYDKAKGLSKGSDFGKWLGNILIVKLPFSLWNFIESKNNSI